MARLVRAAVPPALRAWLEVLEPLRPAAATAFNDWVPRLVSALGLMTEHRTAPGTGLPDGYGGLTRRPDYERLLASEWALAEAYPDEFLRRAVMREHLFLAPLQRKPLGDQRTLVLLDAGPEQCGSPRLVHLLTLLLLVRHEALHGTPLAWAIAAQGVTHDGFDRSLLQTFKQGTSWVEPDRDLVARWRRRTVEPGDMVWLVGSAALTRHASNGESTITVAEQGLDHLRVEVQRRDGTRVHAVLALPEPPLRAQILRDPFRRRPRTTPRMRAPMDTGYSIQFGPRGSPLHVSTPTRSWMLSLPRHSRRRARVLGPAPWPVEGPHQSDIQQLGLLRSKQRTVRLGCTDTGHLVLHGAPIRTPGGWRRAGRSDPAHSRLVPSALAPVLLELRELQFLPRSRLRAGGNRSALLITDALDQLWVLGFPDPFSPASLTSEQACERLSVKSSRAIPGMDGNSWVSLERDATGLRRFVFRTFSGDVPDCESPLADLVEREDPKPRGPGEVQLHSLRNRRPHSLELAWQEGDAWQLGRVLGTRVTEMARVTPPPGALVIGIGARGTMPGIVHIADNRLEFSRPEAPPQLVADLPGQPVQGATSPSAGLVALLYATETHDPRLQCIDLRSGLTLLETCLGDL